MRSVIEIQLNSRSQDARYANRSFRFVPRSCLGWSRVRGGFLVALLLVGACLLPNSGVAQESGKSVQPPDSSLPVGLEVFLEARGLEAEGRYREAAEKYSKAIEDAPDVAEIRVAYASLLFNIGMADNAVGLLDGRTDLDWYGKRVYGLALAQAAAGRPEYLAKARATLRDAYAQRSDDPNLLFALARVHQDLGEIEEAEVIVAEMREIMPFQTQLQSLHGQLLLRLGRSREAADVFRLCATGEQGIDHCREGLLQGLVASNQAGAAGEAMIEWLDADDLDGLLRAADLLFGGDRPERALEVVREVLSQEPDSPRARLLEALLLADLARFAEAQPLLRKLLRKNPDDVELLLASAWTEGAGGGGDLEKARRLLNRAWELVADDAGSAAAVKMCLYAARLELAADHGSGAREWLDRIADYEAAGPQMLYLLAQSYRSGENPREGAAALLRLQPHLSPDLRRVAIALEADLRFQAGDQGALRLLRPLLDSDDLGDRLTGIQVLQAAERWDEVAEESARAVEIFGNERPLVFSQAAGLERLQRFDEAAELFEGLLEADPDDTETANYLGYMYANASVKLDRALELIRQAVEADPENAAYLDSLGWVEFRYGRLGEAERWLRRALEMGAEGDGTVLAHLGEVLAGLGRDDEAVDLLQQSLDLGCEHADRVESLLEEIRRPAETDGSP